MNRHGRSTRLIQRPFRSHSFVGLYPCQVSLAPNKTPVHIHLTVQTAIQTNITIEERTNHLDPQRHYHQETTPTKTTGGIALTTNILTHTSNDMNRDTVQNDRGIACRNYPAANIILGRHET